jgi:hypothetical protein
MYSETSQNQPVLGPKKYGRFRGVVSIRRLINKQGLKKWPIFREDQFSEGLV